ncbi:MAG: caspase family protein [Deltaproteobacteria bacterium]|nr:caspase family protein [Deltaproteobacteria bacterium]
MRAPLRRSPLRALRFEFVVLWVVLLGLPAGAFARKKIQRFALIIANNRGQDSSRDLRHAHSDARKFSQVLMELGGFSPTNVTVLLGRSRGDVLQALKTIETKIRRSKEHGPSLLVLFYSGHADLAGLELGARTLPYAHVTRFMRNSSATIRLAFIDACLSGRLVATKGGQRGPAFPIKITDELRTSGYAIITSSAANELSQESSALRGSFFTHYLVSALRGAADTPKDGRVTLSETYRYVYGRTLARTAQTLGGGQHPMFDYRLAGRGEVTLTWLARQAQLTVESRQRGRYLVLDPRGESLIAEARATPGERAQLSLSPGPYQLLLLAGGSVWRTQVQLTAGENYTVDSRSFVTHKLQRAFRKGGIFPTPVEHQLNAGLTTRRMPLQRAGPLIYSASVAYRLALPSGWQPVGRLFFGGAPDEGSSTGYIEVGGQLGMGYRLPWPVGTGRIELLAGYEYLAQDATTGIPRHSSAGSYLLQLGADITRAPFILSLDVGLGGRVFRLRDVGVEHTLDLQLTLSLGYRWSGE